MKKLVLMLSFLVVFLIGLLIGLAFVLIKPRMQAAAPIVQTTLKDINTNTRPKAMLKEPVVAKQEPSLEARLLSIVKTPEVKTPEEQIKEAKDIEQDISGLICSLRYAVAQEQMVEAEREIGTPSKREESSYQETKKEFFQRTNGFIDKYRGRTDVVHSLIHWETNATLMRIGVNNKNDTQQYTHLFNRKLLLIAECLLSRKGDDVKDDQEPTTNRISLAESLDNYANEALRKLEEKMDARTLIDGHSSNVTEIYIQTLPR